MRMVYGLLKHRIKYVRDDKDSEEGVKNMDEIWINYCGMLICFGLQEIAIVTGLRCDRPEEPITKANRTAKPPQAHKGKALSQQPPNKSNKRKGKIDGLLEISGRGYKALNLIIDLKDKTIPKHYREKLFLVWFVYSVILTRDINKVMDYPDEVSHSRMFRWLAAKNNTRIKEANLFNLPDDVVHWGAFSGGVAGGVDVGGRHADATPSHDVEHVDAREKINMFHNTPLTEAITKVVKELKTKRGVIPSKKVKESYSSTTAVRRKKRAISQVLSNQKSKKITTPPFPKTVKVQGPFKMVDI
ncbi:hypothetical protein FXO37_30065 [Capsicum annuum]|nr:hypothetical protein FXO37_30065 [Capsicum annuum]